MAGSREPLWWLLFAAGGTVAAFLVPVHIVLTAITAAGWVWEAPTYDQVRGLVAHPISRLYLFVLIALPLFHWAHRFRFTLVDLGLHRARRLIAILCYGTAVAGAVATAAVLLAL